MKQIRNNVFETNSSSTHSITISGLSDKYEKPDKPIHIQFGQYGWEQERYHYIEDKLSYVFTMIQYHLDCSWDSKEMKNENIVNTIVNSQYSKWIQEMIKEYCNQDLIISGQNDSYYPAGYIDHQSTDILDEWWFDNEVEFKKSMKEFIFNSKYGFVTDNDNH